MIRRAQILNTANPSELSAIHPDVIVITGLASREWTDVKTDHQRHLLTEHLQTPGEATTARAFG